MQRTKILLVCGGESSEHDVSISSARNVFAAIDDTKFDVILGYIDRHGKWWLIDSIDGEISTHGAPQLVPVFGAGSFVTLPSSQLITPDVIFPVLHGKNGEDGSVQGVAQLLHIPVVGCDVTASSAAMDKALTKQLLQAHDISIVPYVTHYRQRALPDFNQLSMNLGLPLFVKPARSGSSVGVSRVYSEDELAQALELAHQHDDVALIERGISGRELEVAVLGDTFDHQTSSVGEVSSGADFYDYEAKYASTSDSQVTIPADIDQVATTTLRTLASRVYTVLGCRGLARVDFFLSDDGTIYVNEVNTMPGFTNVSMYPKLWRHDGMSYSQLVENLITLALGDTIKDI